jgi:hypothetical protein
LIIFGALKYGEGGIEKSDFYLAAAKSDERVDRLSAFGEQRNGLL